MSQNDSWWTTLIALDLGTASLTSCWLLARDTIDADGHLHRRCKKEGKLVQNWAASGVNNTLGNPCFPTTLVYHRGTRKLLYSGFEAQRYIAGQYPNPHPDTVYTIKYPKLLFVDTEHQDIAPEALTRYKKSREELKEVLGKDPADVFEDLLTSVLTNVLTQVKRYAMTDIEGSCIELVPSLPPGFVERYPNFILACNKHIASNTC